jgi:hypothetical protein
VRRPRTRAADDPTTPAPSRAALPAERAFVVQLRADADVARGIVAGRIEHVVSGVAAPFESVEQMLGCMRDAVARRTDGSRGATDPQSRR